MIDPDEDKFKIQLVAQFRPCAATSWTVSRAGPKPFAPIEAAIDADTMCHIADVAMRLDRKVTFDFAKEQFVNDDEANLRLKCRPMRKPWSL